MLFSGCVSGSNEHNPEDQLRVLHRHHVDFIVVGGVCAVLHGAPVDTFDLDIVHSRDTANLDRLLGALDELGAHYRRRDLKPGRSHLQSPGHQLLDTRFGPLDVLGEIGSGAGAAVIADQLREYGLLVADRHGRYEPPPRLLHRVRRLDVPEEATRISATQVRERIAAGVPWEHLVPETVVNDIRHLYSSK